ncbi:MAG: hypothetical protein ACOZNI_01860 [Myxococcota bacterium]
MTTPTILLRDACLAGLVLAGAGTLRSAEFGGQVAAGALGAVLNMALLVWTVRAMGSPSFLLRLLLAHVGGAAMLIALVASLDVVPVFVGFCAALLALAVRGFAGLLPAASERA